MDKRALVCGVLLLAATLSCTREQDFDSSVKMVFQATWADNPDTKTAIQEDGTSVWWSPKEEISIFHGRSYGKFTSTNTTPQATVTFEGTFSEYDGRSVAEYCGIYPYGPGNYYYEGKVYLEIESVQQGKEGTFADKAFPAVGISNSQSIAFYHVCGGARFTVANEGITSVTFESLGGEPLSGFATVTFVDDGPVASVTSYSATPLVTVNAPEGGFVPGKYYFAAFVPGTLSQGLNVTYSKSDGTFAEIALDKPITVRRARFGTIDRKDQGLTFKGYEVTTPTAVDMGLSVKWASFNIGATKPTEPGYHYAWGETEPKKVYDWETYKWSDIEGNLTKYNYDADAGTVDNKIQLDEDDDVAHVKLGEKWRMPTSAELSELEDTQYDSDYQWNFKTVDGVDGIEIVYLGNGNSIFFPASGFRSESILQSTTQARFWSSSLLESSTNYASSFSVDVDEEDYWGYEGSSSRGAGLTVRPVYGDLPPVIPVESISLDRQQLSLFPEVYYALSVDVQPRNATGKVIIWSSDNESVATVDSYGNVYAVAPGTATITATVVGGTASATCRVTVKAPATTITTPTAVDLGLSVKWASFNVGATKPEESGNYYAWGETEPKTTFSYNEYQWVDGASGKYTKYNYDSSEGTVDNKFTLDAEDDVAHVKLGGKWRMPTATEMEELLDTRNNDGYRWEAKSVNGVPGFEITCLSNHNSIFLPFSGYISSNHLSGFAQYWTASLSEYYPYNAEAGSIEVSTWGDEVYYYYYLDGLYRYTGVPVRPVYGDLVTIPVESVSLNRTKLDIPVGNYYSFSATIQPENATSQRVSWTSSDETVVAVRSNGSIQALAPGTATVTVTSLDGDKTATCQVTVKDPTAAFATPAAVDMGLSVKWASFNVGASKPEENGFYYAWGETEPKPTYTESNYLWCDGNLDQLTKYNFDSAYGLVDNKAKLDDADDVAHVKLGGKWRMPTYEEMNELYATEYDSNYQWTWKTENGCYGLEIVFLANGNKIFLPASGNIDEYGRLYDLDEEGQYWASSCTTSDLRPGQRLSFYAYDDSFYADMYRGRRSYGYSVRPVYGDPPATIPIESISLLYDKAVIPQGLYLNLNPVILPENTTDVVIWTSSDASVATVSTWGYVESIAPGTTTITAQSADGKKKATCQITVQAPATTFTTPSAIDLGLSVKWGSFNLGATKPEEPGNYYGWGETDPKSSDLYNYKWYGHDDDTWEGGYIKYCNDPERGFNGFTDGKTRLDPEDDVVRVKLGGKWRMPTEDEIRELVDHCTWTWTTQNGIKGFQVKGPSGKSIFLPAVGKLSSYELVDFNRSATYFTSLLDEYSVSDAVSLKIGCWDDDDTYHYVSNNFRQQGVTIRPVRD